VHEPASSTALHALPGWVRNADNNQCFVSGFEFVNPRHNQILDIFGLSKPASAFRAGSPQGRTICVQGSMRLDPYSIGTCFRGPDRKHLGAGITGIRGGVVKYLCFGVFDVAADRLAGGKNKV